MGIRPPFLVPSPLPVAPCRIKMIPIVNSVSWYHVGSARVLVIYCHVPAGWGLQQTTRALGSDKTRGQGSFGLFTDKAN